MTTWNVKSELKITAMPTPASILWFRLDLRLADNPALEAALAHNGAVLPIYIWSPDEEQPWQPGAASRWWLHQSLKSLDASLRERGSRLVIRKGASLDTLRQLVKETGANAVFWNRRYEPALIARDTKVKQALLADGLRVESFNSALLFEPWEIKNASGKPFQVFTPFWRACLAKQSDFSAMPAPKKIPAPARFPDSLPLDALELKPKIDWAAGFRKAWQVGEAGAAKELEKFLDEAVNQYPTQRDRPDLRGTSRLSPYLHFGEISPRQVWQTVVGRARRARREVSSDGRLGEPSLPSGAEILLPLLRDRNDKLGRDAYLRQLIWREFAHHLLYHFPHTAEKPLRAEFENFPWRTDVKALRAWQRGQTGFPLVDAGMRELWTTGWMHNRVRMVVASFLVKDLLIPWQEGARWFWDTLVDADLANNTLAWQWVAGCGADAAPYFRIFNPASQAEKFDPNGDYIRRWVPEYGTEKYPRPIVDHAMARMRALSALSEIK
jgi:deoxyribodipyrimidine photo-lyase